MSGLSEKIAPIKAALLADKKKSAVMGVLFVILIAVCVRQFGANSSPEVVEATPSELPITPAPVSEAASPAPQVANPDIAMVARQETSSKKVTTAGMPRELSRNLFTTNAWRSFRPSLTVIDRPVMEQSRGSKSSLWSAALAAIMATQREQRREIVETQKVLAGLQLQSTMTGALPMAYISGRLVREGEVLEGFSVIHISERRVVVRKGMHLHELIMP